MKENNTLLSIPIAARFDDFELQKYHIGDMTIYALILAIFGNEKFTSYSLH